MLFNSLSFALFLPIVFILYWFVGQRRLLLQNVLLLVASYYFYACWNFQFLFLLIFSTLLDYYSGLKIESSTSTQARKFWFWLSIGINLGFLGVFKYFNFFVDSIQDVVSVFGQSIHLWTLKVILPVGISFYTFHGLSYVIDIYKKRIPAEKNFIHYAVFVCYFPLLVAGPIERATHLLPQIKQKRTFHYAQAVDGLRQILWGLFKKIVIADTCATYANQIFSEAATSSGSTLVLGAFFFAFQIYGDFSGYSDIALGTSRLFGMELLQNFKFPYFSRNIAEFWRRWHISLSSWFKDYLYIPLGGSQGGKVRQIRNTFLIFLVSGFWHGANWTFMVWGLLHALYIMPSVFFNTHRNNLEIVAIHQRFPSFKEFVAMVITFSLTTFAWIFFRAHSLTDAFIYIRGIFSKSLFTMPTVRPTYVLVLLVIFISIEWIGRRNSYAIATLGQQQSVGIRWTFYLLLIVALFIFGSQAQTFIYFQF